MCLHRLLFRVLLTCLMALPAAFAAADDGRYEVLLAQAQAGDARAQERLAEAHYLGRGAPRDLSEAERWFRLAAEQGRAGAQHRIAGLYLYGEGRPADFTEAARWFRMAAENGYGTSQYMLGTLLAEGRGVPRDMTEARMWFERAAAQGVQPAQQRLHDMSNLGRIANMGRMFVFPLVLYPLWVLPAAWLLAGVVVRRARARPVPSAAVAQVLVLTPVVALTPGGNIPFLYPWWAMAFAELDRTIALGSLVALLLVSVPVALLIAGRQAAR